MKSGRQQGKQWWVALGAIAVSAAVVMFGRGSLPGPGKATTFVITVVPRDARNLDCALSQSMQGKRCGFDDANQPVTTERPLRPYVTVGHELLLLSGVFESKEVASWLDEALKNRDESRVTLECRTRPLGIVPRVSVRWASDGAFQAEQNVMAAVVDDCVVKRGQ